MSTAAGSRPRLAVLRRPAGDEDYSLVAIWRLQRLLAETRRVSARPGLRGFAGQLRAHLAPVLAAAAVAVRDGRSALQCGAARVAQAPLIDDALFERSRDITSPPTRRSGSIA